MEYASILEEWINHHTVEIEESTAYNYEKALPYIKEALGKHDVDQISERTIHDYVKSLLNSKLTYSSTRLYCKVIKLSLRYALRRGYINYNPADDVKMPRKIQTEIQIYTCHEISLLLSVNGPDWVKNGIVIAFRTGMRPSEIYALKWTDINLERKFISVQRAISRSGSKTKLTKTPAGRRRIDIDSILTKHLIGMKNNSDPDKKYVFPSPPHGRRNYRIPWNLAKKLHEMCDRANVEYKNFYSLRHSHATLLLEMNVHPKIVQERLGHSDIKITLETYSHVTPTIQQKAVEAMETIQL